MAHLAPLAEGLAAMHRLVGSPDQRAAAATVLKRKRRWTLSVSCGASMPRGLCHPFTSKKSPIPATTVS